MKCERHLKLRFIIAVFLVVFLNFCGRDAKEGIEFGKNEIVITAIDGNKLLLDGTLKDTLIAVFNRYNLNPHDSLWFVISDYTDSTEFAGMPPPPGGFEVDGPIIRESPHYFIWISNSHKDKMKYRYYLSDPEYEVDPVAYHNRIDQDSSVWGFLNMHWNLGIKINRERNRILDVTYQW